MSNEHMADFKLLHDGKLLSNAHTGVAYRITKSDNKFLVTKRAHDPIQIQRFKTLDQAKSSLRRLARKYERNNSLAQINARFDRLEGILAAMPPTGGGADYCAALARFPSTGNHESQ